MFGWFRSKRLEDVLGKPKKVWIDGVPFKIRKINPLDYLQGSKAIVQIYQTARKFDPDSVEVKNDHTDKIKAHYIDVFLASVVEPTLKRKKDDGDGLPVEHLLTDLQFSDALYGEIMAHSYGKKNFAQLASTLKTASKST